MVNGTCTFKSEWCRDPEFKDWVQRDKLATRARCKLCDKSVDISSMAARALRSHAGSRTHRDNVTGRFKTGGFKMSSFFTPTKMFNGIATPATQDSVNSIAAPESPSLMASASATATDQGSVEPFVSQTDTLNAEVWWALKGVASGYSFRSNEDLVFTLTQMFPNIPAVSKLTLGETKSMYLTCFGLAPYFRRTVTDKIKDGSDFVLLYDESFNQDMKRKQLDFLVRYWDNGSVQSRYFDSVFMGHATADDILEACHTSLQGKLSFKQILQVSMDGPNVNWAFHRKFDAEIEKEFHTHLIEIGSCGLHTVHNAFGRGANESGWEISKILRAMFTLFDEVPARREDYTTITGSSIFPVQFCGHRWVENAQVADRALEVLPHLPKFIDHVNSAKKHSISTKSFSTICEALKDPLLKAKLAFFSSVAKQVKIYLTEYQTDSPMIPFLASDLERMLRTLMKRFIKKDVIDEANTTSKLMDIEVEKSSNHKRPNRVDLGFVAEAEVRRITAKKKAGELSIMSYQNQCKSFLVMLVKMLIEKAPIKYRIVRHLQCLDPALIKENPHSAKDFFKKVLVYMCEKKRLKLEACDGLLNQFDEFIIFARTHESFICFDKMKDRIDVVYHNILNRESRFSSLWSVIRSLLLLSHGQAAVERGFSVNKNVMEVNLSEHNLIARRLIKDHLDSVGGLKNVQITPAMLSSASAARQNYYAYLDEQKKARDSKEQTERKRKITDELEESKQKRQRIETALSSLKEVMNELMDQGDKSGNMVYYTQASSHRISIKKREGELEIVSAEIKKKAKELRDV